jgi:hypothetical protein
MHVGNTDILFQQSVLAALSDDTSNLQLDLRSAANTHDTIPKGAFTLARVELKTERMDKNLSIARKGTALQLAENLKPVANFDDKKALINPDFSPLQYINVEIESIQQNILGLYDSGAETCLANSTIIEAAKEHITYIRQIKIKPVIGPAIDADFVKINIRLANKQHIPYIAQLAQT